MSAPTRPDEEWLAEWLEMGRELRRRNPERYRQVVAEMKARIAAAREGR